MILLLGTEEAQPTGATILAGHGFTGNFIGPAAASTLGELRCPWETEAPATGNLAICEDSEGKRPGAVIAEWAWTKEGAFLVAKGSVAIPGGSTTLWLVVQPIGGSVKIHSHGKVGATSKAGASANEAAQVSGLTWGASVAGNGPLWMWGLGVSGGILVSMLV